MKGSDAKLFDAITVRNGWVSHIMIPAVMWILIVEVSHKIIAVRFG